ncbi:MAG: PHP domain-containing protein, partial [Hyphomonadaceae bacterium]
AGITVTTANVPGETRVEIVADGLDTEAGAMALGPAPSFKVKLASGASRGWVRVNIRDASGKLLLLGNPIYVTRATSP